MIVEAKAIWFAINVRAEKDGYTGGELTPSKGNDKHTRVNAVAPLFESGMIWAPEQNLLRRSLKSVLHSHMAIMMTLVDSTTQAIMRFRQGGLIDHPEDYVDEKARGNRKGIIING